MRKLVLIAASLVAFATTIDLKPAQAYPWGWDWMNAGICNIRRNVGNVFGSGDAAMDRCFMAYYGN